jgi:ATP diphosphatase
MSEEARALGALVELMSRLRDPERGCPWDLKQTFASIAPYTIEEAYEVADAIERGDPAHLREELGDLLFQVVFHARMAQERGWFDFAAVADSIREKLIRRHPHLFAGAQLAPQDLVRVWEEQKARERLEAGEGDAVLAGIPQALPALVRAAKLGRRASRVGFDWPEAQQVRAKVMEELHEVDAARSAAQRTEEVGDLLFAVANWARHMEVDAEEALRAANGKFQRRFEYMERLAHERSLQLQQLTLAEWEALWCEAKLNGA